MIPLYIFMKNAPFSPEDIYGFNIATRFRISPDGKKIIFSVQKADKKSLRYFSSLWVVLSGGGKPERFTYGKHKDIYPEWSPDSKKIAFLSDREKEGEFQLYIMKADGGEAKKTASMKGEFESISWSPDRKCILCEFRKMDEDEPEEKSGKGKKIRAFRRTSRILFKRDGTGYLPKERRHLHIIDAGTGKSVRLTDGFEFSERSPSWSPDGKSVAFISYREGDPDTEPDGSDIYVMDISSRKMRKIGTPFGRKEHTVFSPDGKMIAYAGSESEPGKWKWWKKTGLWIVPADGGGPAENITKGRNVDIIDGSVGDTVKAVDFSPRWSPDGEKLYFLNLVPGKSVLQSIGPKGDMKIIAGGKGTITSFDVSSDGKIIYFLSDFFEPGDIYILDNGHSQKLTHLNQTFMKSKRLGSVEEIDIKNTSGDDIQGWVMKPPDFDPSKIYPSILQIHGGPVMQYSETFMHEFLLLSSAGYVVFFCNPRGSAGYGEKFAKEILNRWGGPDYDDIMAFTDFVAKRSYIDKNRMGVAGGSYGGFMTNWIIGHTKRFAAAVTERSISNLLNFWGSWDYNHAFRNEIGKGKPPWESPEEYLKWSPLMYAKYIRTPTLVVHSERDMRCPIDQGEQFYTAMKISGVDTELMTFPEESHGLSRGGRPDRRTARLDAISEWFDRYLKTA